MSSTILFLVVAYFSPLDKAIVDEINQYRIELQLREQYKNQKGCPFEPGAYWNIECV